MDKTSRRQNTIIDSLIICISARSGFILLKVICICAQITVPVVFLINGGSQITQCKGRCLQTSYFSYTLLFYRPNYLDMCLWWFSARSRKEAIKLIPLALVKLACVQLRFNRLKLRILHKITTTGLIDNTIRASSPINITNQQLVQHKINHIQTNNYSHTTSTHTNQ